MSRKSDEGLEIVFAIFSAFVVCVIAIIEFLIKAIPEFIDWINTKRKPVSEEAVQQIIDRAKKQYETDTIQPIANDKQEKIKKEQPPKNTSVISFPEYSPEEYQRQKQDREDKALNGCKFFEPLDVEIFKKNLEYFRDKKCPYCGAELPERKGKSYKCPSCKNKIYRMSDIATNFEGLFTETSKEQRNQIINELSKRKNFLKVYNNSCGLIKFGFDEDKKQNIKRVMFMLHEARPYVKSAKNVDSLRMCRFYEAQAQELYGEPSDALNAWLSVAYIDLWGFYNHLYKYRNDHKDNFIDEKQFYKRKESYEKSGMKYIYTSYEEYKKNEIDEYFCEWHTDRCSVAPFVLGKIFKENKPLDILQGLFEFSAKEISKRVQYEPPITPQEAWKKIIESLNNEQTENQTIAE